MDIGEEVLDYSESDEEGTAEEKETHNAENVSDMEEEPQWVESGDETDSLTGVPLQSDTDFQYHETTEDLTRERDSGSYDKRVEDDDLLEEKEDVVEDDGNQLQEDDQEDDGNQDYDGNQEDDGDQDDGNQEDGDQEDDGNQENDVISDQDDGGQEDDVIGNQEDDGGDRDDVAHLSGVDQEDKVIEESDAGQEDSGQGELTAENTDMKDLTPEPVTHGNLDGVTSEEVTNSSDAVSGPEDQAPSGPPQDTTTDLFASDDDDEEEELPPKPKRNRLNSGEDEDLVEKPVQEPNVIQEISDLQEQEVSLEEDEVTAPYTEVQEEEDLEEPASDDDNLAAELAELNEEVVTGDVGSTEYKEDPEEPNDDEIGGEPSGRTMVYDFDLMLEKKKEKARRNRKRRTNDIQLTAHDDVTISLTEKMKSAAEEDRKLNLAQKAATKKLSLLPLVSSSLKKPDIVSRFIDCGGLDCMSEWISPLPDHSLPNQKIRETILDLLKSFPAVDGYTLKKSRIGKAVMLLYRHPKEIRKNKEKAGKLIQEWARPIFGLASDFKTLSRDEREERDYAHITPTARRRLSSTEDGQRKTGMEIDNALKPGDAGWIGRARVPMPSNKDYIVRPKWNVETEFAKGGGKKSLTRYDKQVLKWKEGKKAKGSSHAVKVNVAGNRMAL